MSYHLVHRILTGQLPEGCRSPSHKLVALAYAEHADKTERCWPSKRRVANYSRLSPRRVQDIVADLKRSGLLELLTPEKRHHPPVYRIRGGNDFSPRGS